MKNLYILSLILLLSNNVIAQEKKLRHKTVTYDTTRQEKLDLKISYFGVRIFQPGIGMGTEYITKKKTNHYYTGRLWAFLGFANEGFPTKNYRHESIAFDIAYYHHRLNHNGILFYPSIQRKYIRNSGAYSGIGIGLGQLKTFYPTTTYEANEDGSFSEKKLGGRRYTAMVFNYEYGRDFSFRKDSQLKLFYRIDFYFLFKYNNGLNANIAHRIGIAFPLIPNPIKQKSATL